MRSKTINANGVKNSSSLAAERLEKMNENAGQYINEELGIPATVMEIDEENGLIEISCTYFDVRMDFNGDLFQFKPNIHEYLDNEDLEALNKLYNSQDEIIEAMFDGAEEAV